MAKLEATLALKTTAQWLALNAYRITLEAIVREYRRDPVGFTGEEAAEFARLTLEEFPGGFKQ